MVVQKLLKVIGLVIFLVSISGCNVEVEHCEKDFYYKLWKEEKCKREQLQQILKDYYKELKTNEVKQCS